MKPDTLAEIGEFGLIKLLTGSGVPPGGGVVKDAGDDCAVIRFKRGKYLLWTTDILFAGKHFDHRATPYQIGWKSLAVSISDIAAMAGKPRYALIFTGLPPTTPVSFATEIYRGIKDLAARFRVKILGGDTNAFPQMIIGTTVLGEVEKEYLTLRSGARPGDLVCLSGPLGKGSREHLSFIPRVRTARLISRKFSPSAMIDISDGLLSDFTRVAEESRVGGEIYLAQIPRVPGVSAETALTSGEEFELLFTIDPKREAEVKRAGFFITGKIKSKAAGISARYPDRRLFRPAVTGYDHFRHPREA